MGNFNKALEIYDAIVAQCPGIERKGKTVPYTSDNGYMFSLVNKDGEIGIRFAKEVQQAYMEKYNSTLFRSHGANMRGYILITEEMLKDQELVVSLLKESQAHVMSLEPK